MANIPQLLSKEQLIGLMVNAILAQLKGTVDDLNIGSTVAQLTEAIGQVVYKPYADIIAMLTALNVDNATGDALQRIANDNNVPIFPALPASGFVDITDTTFQKILSTLYAGQPAPVAGSLIIYVTDASKFAPNGTIYLGRGTANSEGPLTYTSIMSLAGGTYYALNLSVNTPTAKFHSIGETVIMGQGGNRNVPAGTVVTTQQSSSISSVNYITTVAGTILDGEVTVTNLPMVSRQVGTIGNVPAGAIQVVTGLAFNATAYNEQPLYNGRPADSDDDIQNRIKEYDQLKAKGTAAAIDAAAINVTSPDDLKTVTSASTIEYAGDGAALVFDDGSGYEPLFVGVGVETVIPQALGGEDDMTLRHVPTAQARIQSNQAAPYDIPNNYNLNVTVNGVTTSHQFLSSDFAIPAAATAYEVMASINSDPRLNFLANTAGGGQYVVIFPKDPAVNNIMVNSLTSDDANAILKFIADSITYTVRLYKNDVLLFQDGELASVSTEPQPAWSNQIVSGDTLVYQVDNTPPITVTFTLEDFQAVSQFATVSSTQPLSIWIQVLNNLLSGVNASISGNSIVLTSNRGYSNEAQIAILGGTLAVKMFSLTESLSSIGQASDFSFNRNTSQLELVVPLTVGDKLTVGSAFTNAKLTSVSIVNGPSVGGNIWFLVDGNAELLSSGLNNNSQIEFSRPAFTNTSLSRTSGVVTVNTASPNGFVPGEIIDIEGAVPTDFNGSFVVVSASGTQYTFAQPGSDEIGTLFGETFGGATTLFARDSISLAPIGFTNVLPGDWLLIWTNAGDDPSLVANAGYWHVQTVPGTGEVTFFNDDGISSLWLSDVPINRIVFVRSLAPIQLFTFAAEPLADFAADLKAQILGVNTAIIGSTVRVSTQTSDTTGQILVLAADTGGQTIGFPISTIVNNTTSQLGFNVTNSLYNGFPSFTYSSITSDTDNPMFVDANDSYYDLGGDGYDFLQILPSYNASVPSTVPVSSEYLSAFVRSFDPATDIITTLLPNYMLDTPAADKIEIQAGNRFFLRESYQFDSSDILSVVVDGQPDTQTFNLSVARRVEVTGATAPTQTSFSAADLQSSLALNNPASFKGFDFSDFKVWREANTVLTDGVYDLEAKFSDFGPSGNFARVGILYPSSITQTDITSQITVSDTIDIGLVLPVATPRTATWDGTSSFIVSVVTIGGADIVTYTWKAGKQPNFNETGGSQIVAGDVVIISPSTSFLPNNASISAKVLSENLSPVSFAIRIPTGIASPDAPTFSSVVNYNGIITVSAIGGEVTVTGATPSGANLTDATIINVSGVYPNITDFTYSAPSIQTTPGSITTSGSSHVIWTSANPTLTLTPYLASVSYTPTSATINFSSGLPILVGESIQITGAAGYPSFPSSLITSVTGSYPFVTSISFAAIINTAITSETILWTSVSTPTFTIPQANVASVQWIGTNFNGQGGAAEFDVTVTLTGGTFPLVIGQTIQMLQTNTAADGNWVITAVTGTYPNNTGFTFHGHTPFTGPALGITTLSTNVDGDKLWTYQGTAFNAGGATSATINLNNNNTGNFDPGNNSVTILGGTTPGINTNVYIGGTLPIVSVSWHNQSTHTANSFTIAPYNVGTLGGPIVRYIGFGGGQPHFTVYQTAVPITSLVSAMSYSASTVTVTLSTPIPGMATGDTIQVTGAVPGGANVPAATPITVSGSQFTYSAPNLLSASNISAALLAQQIDLFTQGYVTSMAYVGSLVTVNVNTALPIFINDTVQVTAVTPAGADVVSATISEVAGNVLGTTSFQYTAPNLAAGVVTGASFVVNGTLLPPGDVSSVTYLGTTVTVNLSSNNGTILQPFPSFLGTTNIKPGDKIGIYNTAASIPGVYPFNAIYSPTIINSSSFTVPTPLGTPGGAIQSLTQSNNLVTVTTVAPHGLAVGDVVLISDASISAYNGFFAVYNIPAGNPTHQFQYVDPGSSATIGGGHFDFQSYLPIEFSSGILTIQNNNGVVTVTTVSAHGLPTPSASTTVLVSIMDVIFPAWSNVTIYGLGQIVSDPSNVLALYKSLTAGNTGNPITDTAHWLPTEFDFNGIFQVYSVPLSTTFTFYYPDTIGNNTYSGGVVTQYVQTGSLARTINSTNNLGFAQVQTTSQALIDYATNHLSDQLVLSNLGNASDIVATSTQDSEPYLSGAVNSIYTIDGSYSIVLTVTSALPVLAGATITVTTQPATAYSDKYIVLLSTPGSTPNQYILKCFSSVWAYTTGILAGVTGSFLGYYPYQIFSDGENSVQECGLNIGPLFNPNFIMKYAWNTIPAIGEEIRLVATTQDQLTRFWNEPVVSGLSNVATITNSKYGKEIQIETDTFGSAGSIQIVDSLANNGIVALSNSGYEINNKLGAFGIPYALRKGIIHGSWLKLTQTVTQDKILGFDNTTQIQVLSDGFLLNPVDHGIFQTKIITSLDTSTVFAVERHGSFFAFIAVGGTSPMLGASGVQEGDWVRIRNVMPYEYVTTATYRAGNKVLYNQQSYVAIFASPFSGQVPTDTTYWTPYTTYDLTVSYTTGMYANFDGRLWLALQPSLGVQPAIGGSDWQPIEWNIANNGIFQVVRVFGENAFWVAGTDFVPEIVRLNDPNDLAFYSYDSVMPGDIVDISGNILGAANIGQYTVLDDAIDGSSFFPTSTRLYTTAVPAPALTSTAPQVIPDADIVSVTYNDQIITVTLSAPVDVSLGQFIQVTGASPAGANVSLATVTSVGSLTFTYNGTTSGSGAVTGAIISLYQYSALGNFFEQVNVTEKSPIVLYKHVVSVGPGATGSNLATVTVDTPILINKISNSLGAYLTMEDKLDYDLIAHYGIDGYKYYNGLLKQLNLVIYGDPTSPLTNPGVRAAGTNLDIKPSSILRIELSVNIRIKIGLSPTDISNRVKSSIAGYVNQLDVGEAVALAGVIDAAWQVNGVTSVAIVSPTYSATHDEIAVGADQTAKIINPQTDITVSIVGD